jgi:hypothetical protein
MSEWNDAKLEDLSISLDGKELDIHFDTNYNGRVWVSVPLEDVKKVIREYEDNL